MASRYTQTVRYASRHTGVNFEKWLTWGAIGVGAYFIFKLVSFGSAAAKVLTTTGEAVGSGLYDFFHRDPLGETTYYLVRFPDGSRHSVASRSVDNSGLFKNTGDGRQYAGDGELYRLVIEKATKNYFAVRP